MTKRLTAARTEDTRAEQERCARERAIRDMADRLREMTYVQLMELIGEQFSIAAKPLKRLKWQSRENSV